MKWVVVPAVKRVPNPRSVPQRPNTEEIDPKIKNNQVEKSETFPKKNGSQCTASYFGKSRFVIESLIFQNITKVPFLSVQGQLSWKWNLRTCPGK